MLRAGLDYHEFATITVHESWADCAASVKDRRLFAVSTKGTQRYDLVDYAAGDVFVFGPESRGLPAEILGSCFRATVYPRTHGPGKPEPQSLQHRGGGHLRSVAAGRIWNGCCERTSSAIVRLPAEYLNVLPFARLTFHEISRFPSGHRHSSYRSSSVRQRPSPCCSAK